MAAPDPRVLSATTTQGSFAIGSGISDFILKNVGNDNVYIDFDADIDANSYLLSAGETMNFTNITFTRLMYKADSSTATLYIILVKQ